MDQLTLTNPVFTTYAVCAALGVLKIMGQGWVSVYRLLKVGGGYASPEDLRPGFINRKPDPAQLELNDYVDRSRRMHRNDLENIPAFLVSGLLFATTAPPFWLAALLYALFVLARLAHTFAYATAQNHEVRAAFYSVGSIVVVMMALWVLAVALL